MHDYIMAIFFLFWVISFIFIAFIILDYSNSYYNYKKEFFVSSPVKNIKIRYSKYRGNVRTAVKNVNDRIKNVARNIYRKIF
jgi:hypothetical protein